jgi:hypothetical protein
MKKRILCILAFTLGLAGSAAASDNPPMPAGGVTVRLSEVGPGSSLLQDPYVRLYLARLQKAKLEIESSKQRLLVALKQRERLEMLYARNAVSAQELEEIRRDAELAQISVQQAQVEAVEAEVFVDIALSRISLGLEMPICAEIR